MSKRNPKSDIICPPSKKWKTQVDESQLRASNENVIGLFLLVELRIFFPSFLYVLLTGKKIFYHNSIVTYISDAKKV